MSENTEKKVRKIIADVLSLSEEEVANDFSYRDTDRWDSLKHMEIITALEQSFSQTFMIDEITQMTSVEDIMNILNQKNAGGI